MTEVAFHFNVPDKLAYACRLLRKAHQSGARVGVVGPADFLNALDLDLWRFSALDFVPHCHSHAPAPLLAASPIVLAAQPADLPEADVLVNTGDAVPEGFERFERLIELVAKADDHNLARQRWRHYAQRGYNIQRHDLAAPA